MQRSEGAHTGRHKGVNPLAAAVFMLVTGGAGLFYWLHSSYDPDAEFKVPSVALKLEAKSVKAAKPAISPTTAKPDSAAEAKTAPKRPPPPKPTVMAEAPNRDLIEKTDIGGLPVVAPDGRSSLSVYANPHGASGQPQIAVVLGDIGLNLETTIASIQQLPGTITLAFSPYGSNLSALTRQAREGGHEILLQMPMEPLTFLLDDPGPHTLLTSLPVKANIERLEWIMSRFSGYIGIVNHMGSRFTASDEHLQPIMATLHRRGLMYLESGLDGRSVASDLASAIGMPSLASSHILDREASIPYIDAQLQALEATARKKGIAIAIASPYPVTIERLSQWSRTLPTKGIELAPISALLKRRRK